MLFSLTPKLLFAGSLLTASVGIGGMVLFTENSVIEENVLTKEQENTGSKKEVEVIDVVTTSEEKSNAVETVSSENGVSSNNLQEPQAESVTLTQTEVHPKPKHGGGKCTIYKVIISGKNKSVAEAEIGFLETEKKLKTKSYIEIEQACDKAGGKDIFISKRRVWYGWLPYIEWGYSESEQELGRNLKNK